MPRKLNEINRNLAFVICLFFASSAFAQKYSNEFLSIGAGARAQGMGNAMVAGVDDVTSAYWNPAGLVRIKETTGLQAMAMHAEWFAGVGNYDYLGVSIPMRNKRRLALSMIRFGIDGIPNTLSLFEDDGTVNYNNILEFSAADYAFLLTYAQPLKVRSGDLSIGGNMKIIRRIIGTFADSWGFGVDVGAQYRKGNFQFGLLAKDLTTTFNAWSINYTDQEKVILLQTGNDLPDLSTNEITKQGFNLGAAYTVDAGIVKITPEVNMVMTTDGKRNVLLSGNTFSADLAFGVEVNYKNSVFLRGGVDQFQEELNFDGSKSLLARPSLGIGLNMGSFRVDYAFGDLDDSRNTYSHVVSLLLDLKIREREDADFWE